MTMNNGTWPTARQKLLDTAPYRPMAEIVIAITEKRAYSIDTLRLAGPLKVEDISGFIGKWMDDDQLADWVGENSNNEQSFNKYYFMLQHLITTLVIEHSIHSKELTEVFLAMEKQMPNEEKNKLLITFNEIMK